MALFKNINFDKLKSGLSKTRDKIVNNISEVLSGKAQLGEDVLEDLEDILITSDIGFDTSAKIIENTRAKLRGESDRSGEKVYEILKGEMVSILENYKPDNEKLEDKLKKFNPYVILVVGVNGAGKTTTIGKLAHNYKQAGLKVVIGSADTFRAAANEQLEVWANRAGVEVVQKAHGSDPSSVAFDTLNIAKKQNADIVMIDTAGRLHTKNNLMLELQKIRKVLEKVVEHAPNEVFLVVDGNTGQNALQQAREFSKFTDLTGLIVTKLDGTAKGGMIFQICSEQNIPVKYIGVGESISDLQNFEPKSFIDALFSKLN